MGDIVDRTVGEGKGSASKYLILSVNGYIYAVKVPFVRKIMSLSRVSRLPREEPYVLGVTKADDMIYTVVDLRILFGGEYKALPNPAVAVLLTYGGAKICAVADAALTVADIDTKEVSCPFKREYYISGIVQSCNGNINILSIDKLLGKSMRT